MTCDHFRKDKINKIYNEKGKLTEYDLACSVCGQALKHYKYGIMVRNYEKENVFMKIYRKIASKLVDYFEYKIAKIKILLKL